MPDIFTVYIDGNGYGFGNIGDDAILQGIIRILRTVPEISTITVATKDGKRLPFLDDDVHVSVSFDINSAWGMIKESDCLLVGGGTMIGDELGLHFPLGYNVERILYSKKIQKKTILFGIGANNPGTIQGRELAKIMINHSDLVSVRDTESSVICRTLSCNHARIFQSADPAFLLEPKETVRSKKMKELIRSKGKTIGINVVNEVWAGKKGYKKAIANACALLREKQGFFPVFISNEIRPGAFFDSAANRETASFLNCEYLIIEPQYFMPEEMIDIISAFDLFLSMRMHGLIFASIAGVPFATISRIDKVDNFMHLFNRESSGTIDTVKAEFIQNDLEFLIRERDQIKSGMLTIVQKNRSECMKNAEYFQECLNLNEEKKPVTDRIKLLLDIMKYKICMKI